MQKDSQSKFKQTRKIIDAIHHNETASKRSRFSHNLNLNVTPFSYDFTMLIIIYNPLTSYKITKVQLQYKRQKDWLGYIIIDISPCVF